MIATQTLPEHVVGEAASVESHPVQWWYVNALLDAPGTPVHEMAFVAIFSIFEGVIEEGRHLLLSPDGGVFADFGTGALPKGTIKASSRSLDVRNGANSFTGGYPEYDVHVEGTATSGAFISVDLSYTAEVEPEREGYINSQFKHWVVYRAAATGEIRIGDRSYPVAGLGYLEHLFGTLGWREPFLGAVQPPIFVNGWNWYWAPAAGPDRLVVQAGGFVTEGAPVPFVSVTTDGKDFHHFTSGTFEMLETREVEGVEYVHRFRLTDSTPLSSVDLTVTRRDAAQRTIRSIPGGSKGAFVTGFAELEGSVTVDGTTYDVTSPAFGSAFTISLSKPMDTLRNLHPALRVPLGRLMAGISLLMKGR